MLELWHFGVYAPVVTLNWRKDEAEWCFLKTACVFFSMFACWEQAAEMKSCSSCYWRWLKSERSSWMWWFTAEAVKHRANLEGSSCFVLFCCFWLSAHRGGHVFWFCFHLVPCCHGDGFPTPETAEFARRPSRPWPRSPPSSDSDDKRFAGGSFAAVTSALRQRREVVQRG